MKVSTDNHGSAMEYYMGHAPLDAYSQNFAFNSNQSNPGSATQKTSSSLGYAKRKKNTMKM